MERKILAFACVSVATIFVGLSLYGCWSLREMGLDSMEAQRTVQVLRTMYGEQFYLVSSVPQQRFLGNGLIGTVAPAAFAVLGMILLWTGWNVLADLDYIEYDEDDPEKEDLPGELPRPVYAVAGCNDNLAETRRTGTAG